jgi:hypothetical protein
MDSECQQLYDNADKLNELLSLVSNWLSKRELQCLDILAKFIATKAKTASQVKSISQFDKDEAAAIEEPVYDEDGEGDPRSSALSMFTIPKEYQINYDDFKTG